jgi:hypothetical protein
MPRFTFYFDYRGGDIHSQVRAPRLIDRSPKAWGRRT